MPDRPGIAPSRPAGRYAPTPSGDLHLGNLRTAVLADLFARTTERVLLLRIDDLDPARARSDIAASQRRDLEDLGLRFEPPELRQSERGEVYAEALGALTAAGRTFECFCSRREVAEATAAPHLPAGRYPGTCRDLTKAERDERRARRPPAIRLRSEAHLETVHDLVVGELSGPVDDLVLRRNDGAYGYHLATVVDDRDSGVDQVVRGDDLLPATPGQAYLSRLLGGAVPVYAHVPLAANTEGRRLAKRDGAVTAAELAALGVTPAGLLSRIAESLGLAEAGEPVDLTVLAERFDPAHLPRHPWVVDPATLATGG